MLSLSTAFNIKKHTDGKKLVEDILDMGFSAMELNVEVDEEMLKQILLQVKRRKIKISSVHNFCPKLKDFGPHRSIFSAYRLSSLDKEERKQAVELTKKTIDLAEEFGAQGVVIHAGEVETQVKGQELFRYVRDFGKTKIYDIYKDLFFKERKRKCKPYLITAIRSLEEISKYAAKLKIKVGIENRFYYNEIPSFEEIGVILHHFRGNNVYYWHDTGHAQIFQHLEFVPAHEEYLKKYADKMLGMHLHDVKGLSDHQAPGVGIVDFKMIKKYLSKDIIKVVEAHSKSSRTQVKKSVTFLKNLGIA
ncbi:sugar phosphate isomerase/epimerase [bacterium]|nr:sugar phosphate isomerase/epimerase [bacterium]